MKRTDILMLARKEMDLHGLVNWKVKFVSSKSFAGQCRRRNWNTNPRMTFGYIDLSTDFFDVFEDHDILDTIRHEIAHALTENTYIRLSNGRLRAVHHGKAWKETAKRIGCSGERCVRQGANRPKGRYRGVCPNGHEHSRHRLTHEAKHSQSCGKCSRSFSREYMLDWYDNNNGGKLVHANSTQLLQKAG